MKRMRRFTASVEYRDDEGRSQEDSFPVQVEDYSTAKRIAVDYVLQVLRLEDFELRIVGA
jgi:hypothetical protein